jgi:hypothetical protein
LGAAPEHVHALGLAALYWQRLRNGGHARRMAGYGRVRSEAQLSNLDKPTLLSGEDYQVIGGNPNAHVLSRL